MVQASGRRSSGLVQASGWGTGDFMPLVWLFQNDSWSDVDDAYGSAGDRQTTIQWDHIAPAGVQTEVVLTYDAVPNGDSLSVRVYNPTDGETVIEETGVSTAGLRTVGPVDYSPTTTNSAITLGGAVKNADNSTRVDAEQPRAVIGYTLG